MWHPQTTSTPMKLAVLFTVLCSLVLISCARASTHTPSPLASTTSIPTEPGYSITHATETQAAKMQSASPFQPVPCGIPIPEGVRVTCGDMTVSEDRSRLGGRLISLRVAILHSQDPQPEPDPILVLNGGPGGYTLDSLFYWTRAFGSALAQRDVIVFDQRGVGYSRPSLACPEIMEKYIQDLGQNLTTFEMNGQGEEALKVCRNRLAAEGVSLAAYTSAASAADVNDLRLALGYSEWNIYGISYGTRLALTVLRDFPQGVRSMTLDSTYPLQVDLYSQTPANAERAFDRFFELCLADEACNQAYPDLKQTFFELADRLNADPLTVKVIRPSTGQQYPILINGDRLVNQFYGLLYLTDAIPYLPKMIYALRDGQTQEYVSMLGIIFSSDYTSLGMGYSVQCAEEVPFTSADAIRSAAAKVSPPIRTALDNSSILLLCEIWNSRPAAASENMPVSSDLPVLILAGELDPITPPDWGRLAAETLPNAHFYEFPGMGHGILGQGSMNFDCSYEILDAFLAHPASAPDGSCAKRYKLHFKER